MKSYAGRSFFFFNDTATTEIYTLSLHDALPIYPLQKAVAEAPCRHPLDVAQRQVHQPALVRVERAQDRLLATRLHLLRREDGDLHDLLLAQPPEAVAVDVDLLPGAPLVEDAVEQILHGVERLAPPVEEVVAVGAVDVDLDRLSGVAHGAAHVEAEALQEAVRQPRHLGRIGGHRGRAVRAGVRPDRALHAARARGGARVLRPARGPIAGRLRFELALRRHVRHAVSLAASTSLLMRYCWPMPRRLLVSQYSTSPDGRLMKK